jgi:hypothetical protein
MALRDAVKMGKGAQQFATALFNYLHGDGSLKDRFSAWCESVAALPRRQIRVLTWPLVTVFGFIAQPRKHFFVKPRVTRKRQSGTAMILNIDRDRIGKSIRAF